MGRLWCCRHKDIECATTTAVQIPFNCHEDAVSAWHEKKRAWCCAQEQLGCVTTSTLLHFKMAATTTSSPPYNCGSWYSGWSARKRAWCCAWEHAGCPEHRGDHGGDADYGLKFVQPP